MILELVCLALLILLILGVLWIVPKHQTASFAADSDKDRFEMENAARDTLTKVITGLFVLVGFMVTLQSINVSKEAADVASKSASETVVTTKRGQVNDQFTRAMDLLGRNDTKGVPVLESRVGGIYSLERIAIDSPSDHWVIMETLSSYLRLNSPAAESPADNPRPIRLDNQVVATVIGQRGLTNEDTKSQRLDLSYTNLPAAKLQALNFARANLNGTRFMMTNCRSARFEEASFREARMRAAILDEAHFEGADLETADVTQDQIDSAYIDDKTHLPANLKRTGRKN